MYQALAQGAERARQKVEPQEHTGLDLAFDALAAWHTYILGLESRDCDTTQRSKIPGVSDQTETHPSHAYQAPHQALKPK